ncbi:MAG: hypothetical protein HZB76_07200 [Chlamydiae bacterium]|nr:hypothetical protein [Chlamydiota bacterium]
MLKKRIFGIIIALLGIALLLTSFYIKSRIEEGKKQIAEAESKVNQGITLFSLNPITKEASKGFKESAQQKIDAAIEMVTYYETVVLWSQVGGALFVILGAGIVFMGRKK